jgi:hypothetical protein
MPGPTGTPCNTPEVDSGTLARTASKPPSISADLPAESKDSSTSRLCRSQICHLTLQRIKKVYGSLDDIKLEMVEKNDLGVDGYVDPESPKTIHVAKSAEDIPQTVEHELIHVRQFAEFFGNVSDDERRKELRDMANAMTQKEWVDWNFQLEKEAYKLAAKAYDMKSPADKRLYLEKLNANAKRANLSPQEVLKLEQETIDNLIRVTYEKAWIGNWKRLRGDTSDLAPPAMPKPTMGR